MNVKLKFTGNSNISIVYFFSKHITEVLGEFKSASFSQYLLNASEHYEYFARGFSCEGDLLVELSSDGDVLYEGEVLLNEADQDATPDELRAEFFDNNEEEYDHVVSFDDWNRKSPDCYMPDLSKFENCIIRSVDLDGYNSIVEFNLSVDNEFKPSDLRLIMCDFDGGNEQPQKWACDLVEAIYKAGGVEAELLGVEYRGETHLITDEMYQSDLINEPNTFIGTTSYSAYQFNGLDKWEWSEGLHETLLELSEIED